jgi:hypothetical protein
MRSTTPSTEVPVMDLSPPTVAIDAIDAIGASLDTLAADLRALCSAALESGDFNEVTRLVEASHAVHRAALALDTDAVIALH